MDCLIYDKDGSTRWTEELTSTTNYKRYAPDHSQYWEEIAAEIQCFRANTFVTLFRGGKGVLYREVLCDVCDKMKVKYNKKASIKTIEQDLLMKSLAGLSPQALAAAFQVVFQAGGFKSYQLTLIIVNVVMKALMGRGLAFAANATLARSMAILTGPIGWAITAAWTVIDVGGAAYRVTIPAVIQVAFLRSRKKPESAIEPRCHTTKTPLNFPPPQPLPKPEINRLSVFPNSQPICNRLTQGAKVSSTLTVN